MLEVLWAFREGYSTPTDDERILKRLDDDGEVIGFLIHEMSTLNQPSPVEFELASETPAEDVANVTVRQAAIELGVSDLRVRQLAREGRSGAADSDRGGGDSGEARACRCCRARRHGREPTWAMTPCPRRMAATEAPLNGNETGGVSGVGTG